MFPSLAETSGHVILEAMAMACPVMCVRYGGPAEMIDSEAGYLLDPHSPDQLVHDMRRVILDILENRSQLSDKRIASRRLIEKRFDWSVKGQAIAKLYDEVLTRSARGEEARSSVTKRTHLSITLSHRRHG